MTAARALRKAREAGVEIGLDGADLRLAAASQPPADLLEALAEHKIEIIALLAAEQNKWDDEDWQAYFDERAGVAEHDGGMSRRIAEEQAYESCVTEVLNRSFTPSPPGRCAACGQGGYAHDPLLPFGTAGTGHAWLHGHCWVGWHQGREAEAVAFLTTIGIEPRPLLSDDDRDFIDNDLGR